MLEIFGTEELTKLFSELEAEAQDQIVNQSFRKAAKMIISESLTNLVGVIKPSAHRYTIPKSLGSSLKKSEKQMIIGTRKKYGGRLSALFDEGTESRFYITKSGQIHKTGSIKKTGFFTEAVETTEQPVMTMIGEDLSKRLNKIVRKHNKLKRGAS